MNQVTVPLHDEEIKDMLYKSTFLHERNIIFTNKLVYEKEDLQIVQKLMNAKPNYLMNYGKKLQNQLSSTIDENGDIKEWYSFFNYALNNHSKDKYNEEFDAFYLVLSPFLNFLNEKLTNILENSGLQFSTNILVSAEKVLYENLLEISGTALYINYHEYCDCNKVVPSKDAYKDWINYVLDGGWYRIAYQYPVLARFIYIACTYSINATELLITRLKEDISDVSDMIHLSDISQLKIDDIQFDMSDRHNNGKTVCRIYLNDDKTVIYKPKSMINEKWFFENIVDNFSDIVPSLGKIRVINKEDYGWVEDIMNLPENSKNDSIKKSDIQKIVILFYFLNATDLHHENIIGIGNKFYPADLETILNSTIKEYANTKDNSKKTSWKNWGVLQTMLIKHSINKSSYMNRGDGFSENESISVFKKFFFYLSEEGVFCDLYDPSLLDKEDLITSYKKNEFVNNHIDAEEIIKDFNVILQRMKKLVNDESFINNQDLARLKIREVFRATHLYGRIFQRVYHPKLLRDGALLSLELSELFLQLIDSSNEEADFWGPVIYSEIIQILNCDIPMFIHTSNSNDLTSYDGIIVKNFFENNGIEEFVNKVTSVSKEDIEVQSYIMEASLEADNMGLLDNKEYTEKEFIVSKNEILAFCKKIAEKIASRAILHEDSFASWVSYQNDGIEDIYRPVVLGDNYYSGYWGIFLFIVASKSNIHSNVLNSFIEHENNFWSKNVKKIALYIENEELGISGVGGKLISLSSIYNINEAAWIVKAVEEIYNNINLNSILQDKVFDIIGGNSGFILGSINVIESKLFQKINEKTQKKIFELCKIAALTLVQNANIYQEKGAAWLPINGGKLPLIGFSHGTSGILSSLQLVLNRANLMGLNNDEYKKLRDTIVGALFFQAVNKNSEGVWIDFRKETKEDEVVNASWCHGLPGIGLGLITQLNDDNPDIENDIDIILGILSRTTTEDIGYFCCGECGVIDFLIELIRARREMDLEGLLHNKVKSVVSPINNGCFNGVMGIMKPELFPGAFQGITGIGYTLLRIVDDRLPSLSGFCRF